MPCPTILFVLLVVLVAAGKQTTHKITVYSGPTECDNKRKVQMGHEVVLHYTATFSHTKVRSKRDLSMEKVGVRTLRIAVGHGPAKDMQWHESILGLCQGAKAHVVVPPANLLGTLPELERLHPDVVVKFSVEIVKVDPRIYSPARKRPHTPDHFSQIDTDKNYLISKDEAKAYFGGDQKRVDKLWHHDDRDQDGWISWKEFRGTKGETAPHDNEL